jgi:hypothetical protein
VRLVPVPGRLPQSTFVSQEGINHLTNGVWAKVQVIYTPDKLKPKHQGLNLEQVAMPMVHPTTGETISSYKKLMHDPATSEIWQTVFGKDLGGVAQGNNKTGQKGKNSIFVMTHAEIPHIPKTKLSHTLAWWWTFNPNRLTCTESISQWVETQSTIRASSLHEQPTSILTVPQTLR